MDIHDEGTSATRAGGLMLCMLNLVSMFIELFIEQNVTASLRRNHQKQLHAQLNAIHGPRADSAVVRRRV